MSDDLQAAINTVTQEITLSNGRVIPNRFLKSAMTERLCTWGEDLQERGKPTPEYIRLCVRAFLPSDPFFYSCTDCTTPYEAGMNNGARLVSARSRFFKHESRLTLALVG